MPASTIHATPGAKVVLSFATGGVTPAVHADRTGMAVIQYSGTGRAKVIANGVTKGSFQAPGQFAC